MAKDFTGDSSQLLDELADRTLEGPGKMCDVLGNLEDFGDVDWGQKMQVTQIRKNIAAGTLDPASVSFACKFREAATQH